MCHVPRTYGEAMESLEENETFTLTTLPGDGEQWGLLGVYSERKPGWSETGLYLFWRETVDF